VRQLAAAAAAAADAAVKTSVQKQTMNCSQLCVAWFQTQQTSPTAASIYRQYYRGVVGAENETPQASSGVKNGRGPRLEGLGKRCKLKQWGQGKKLVHPGVARGGKWGPGSIPSQADRGQGKRRKSSSGVGGRYT